VTTALAYDAMQCVNVVQTKVHRICHIHEKIKQKTFFVNIV